MNIREFYVKNYPSDDMGKGINPEATFDGLVQTLNNCHDVYEYLYVYDSITMQLQTKLIDWAGESVITLFNFHIGFLKCLST